MSLQPVSFDLLAGIAQWAGVLGVFVLVLVAVSLLTSLATHGVGGPARVLHGVRQTVQDFVSISPRRVLAIAMLTWKESIRRKALLVFVVFALLFMFASWFLADPTDRPELQIRNYVSFVFTALNMLVLPVVLLLSCWGLPEDIRLRSLHTVVTKPVRRNEVVLGRMFGFWAIGAVTLGLMSVAGYVWVVRQVSSQGDLVCRVPVYGALRFLDREGQPGDGLNVGDIIETRRFIEGGSKMTGIWSFPLSAEAGEIPLESRFEAFRTWKGDMNRTLRVRFFLVNETKNLRVPLAPFTVNEFSQNQMVIPRVVEWTDDKTLEKHSVDVFKDLARPAVLRQQLLAAAKTSEEQQKAAQTPTDDLIAAEARMGVLDVHVQCMDRGQYVGASRGDFFIRLQDRSFAVGYFKAVLGVLLKVLVVVMVGVTSSCFVKWPVATLLSFSVVVVGQLARGFLDKILSGKQLGGGALESIYRLLTHMNDSSPMVEGPLTTVIKNFDMGLQNGLWLVKYIIPDLTTFSSSEWVAKGFDVPWQGILLPSLAITAGYFVPCLLLGYFSLKLRELEAK